MNATHKRELSAANAAFRILLDQADALLTAAKITPAQYDAWFKQLCNNTKAR